MPGQNDFFFRNSPNGSIRKVNWLKTKFELPFSKFAYYRGVRPSLRHFSTKNEKMTGFGHLLDFGSWDVLDIAYYDCTNCFSTFGYLAMS